jgi:nucleolar protein 58
MLATKTSLSVRVDALADVDSKSSPQAPSIGIEYRAKLESRLRALEHRSDLNPGFSAGGSSSAAAFGRSARQQPKFEMNGAASRAKTYNTAADSVTLPKSLKRAADSDDEDDDDGDVDMSHVKKALDAVMDVKEERARRKEEKKRNKEAKRAVKEAKRAEKEKTAAAIVPEPTPEPLPEAPRAMDADDDAKRKESKKSRKEAKRQTGDSELAGSTKKRRVDDDEAPRKKKKMSE